jgi:DNA polymerase-3 subunit alpha
VVVWVFPARQRTAQEVHLALRVERVTEDSLHNLRNVLTQHPGDCPCFLHLLLPNRTETIIRLPRELRVAPTDVMVENVEQLFGRGVATLQ